MRELTIGNKGVGDESSQLVDIVGHNRAKLRNVRYPMKLLGANLQVHRGPCQPWATDSLS
jgi:hypothetical protein